MKRFSIGAIVCSVLMIISACSIGAVGVSALSAEGSELLSELVSAGNSFGINIGDFVPVSTEVTTEQYTSSPNAEDDLSGFLENIGFAMNISSVTDMIAYLNSGKSFSDWVSSQYGDTVDIPESVKGMSTSDIIMYLLDSALYPTETSTELTTNIENIFVTTETQAPETNSSEMITTSVNKTETETESKTESKTNVIIYPSDNGVSLKTGDVNNDGYVTAADARLVLRVSANLDVFSDSTFYAADVNNDGVITAKDARSILRYAAKLSTGF